MASSHMFTPGMTGGSVPGAFPGGTIVPGFMVQTGPGAEDRIFVPQPTTDVSHSSAYQSLVRGPNGISTPPQQPPHGTMAPGCGFSNSNFMMPPNPSSSQQQQQQQQQPSSSLCGMNPAMVNAGMMAPPSTPSPLPTGGGPTNPWMNSAGNGMNMNTNMGMKPGASRMPQGPMVSSYLQPPVGQSNPLPLPSPSMFLGGTPNTTTTTTSNNTSGHTVPPPSMTTSLNGEPVSTSFQQQLAVFLQQQQQLSKQPVMEFSMYSNSPPFHLALGGDGHADRRRGANGSNHNHNNAGGGASSASGTGRHRRRKGAVSPNAAGSTPGTAARETVRFDKTSAAGEAGALGATAVGTGDGNAAAPSTGVDGNNNNNNNSSSSSSTNKKQAPPVVPPPGTVVRRTNMVRIFDNDFSRLLLVPLPAVRQFPPPNKNITRWVICRNDRDVDGTGTPGGPGTCAMGTRCNFVHVAVDPFKDEITSHAVHINYVWRSEAMCCYPKLLPGRKLRVVEFLSQHATASTTTTTKSNNSKERVAVLEEGGPAGTKAEGAAEEEGVARRAPEGEKAAPAEEGERPAKEAPGPSPAPSPAPAPAPAPAKRRILEVDSGRIIRTAAFDADGNPVLRARRRLRRACCPADGEGERKARHPTSGGERSAKLEEVEEPVTSISATASIVDDTEKMEDWSDDEEEEEEEKEDDLDSTASNFPLPRRAEPLRLCPYFHNHSFCPYAEECHRVHLMHVDPSKTSDEHKWVRSKVKTRRYQAADLRRIAAAAAAVNTRFPSATSTTGEDDAAAEDGPNHHPDNNNQDEKGQPKTGAQPSGPRPLHGIGAPGQYYMCVEGEENSSSVLIFRAPDRQAGVMPTPPPPSNPSTNPNPNEDAASKKPSSAALHPQGSTTSSEKSEAAGASPPAAAATHHSHNSTTPRENKSNGNTQQHPPSQQQQQQPPPSPQPPLSQQPHSFMPAQQQQPPPSTTNPNPLPSQLGGAATAAYQPGAANGLTPASLLQQQQQLLLQQQMWQQTLNGADRGPVGVPPQQPQPQPPLLSPPLSNHHHHKLNLLMMQSNPSSAATAGLGGTPLGSNAVMLSPQFQQQLQQQQQQQQFFMQQQMWQRTLNGADRGPVGVPPQQPQPQPQPPLFPFGMGPQSGSIGSVPVDPRARFSLPVLPQQRVHSSLATAAPPFIPPSQQQQQASGVDLRDEPRCGPNSTEPHSLHSGDDDEVLALLCGTDGRQVRTERTSSSSEDDLLL